MMDLTVNITLILLCLQLIYGIKYVRKLSFAMSLPFLVLRDVFGTAFIGRWNQMLYVFCEQSRSTSPKLIKKSLRIVFVG